MHCRHVGCRAEFQLPLFLLCYLLILSSPLPASTCGQLLIVLRPARLPPPPSTVTQQEMHPCRVAVQSA
eukprot:8416092-Pyramimonas_sp.AAC.1